jgi:hypothetical protein
MIGAETRSIKIGEKMLTTLRALYLTFLSSAVLGGVCFAAGGPVFIIQMTKAYYAAALCQNVELNVDRLFAVGAEAGLSKDSVVNIENAILRLNGNTKAAVPPKDVASKVRVAATMLNVEMRSGQETWCSGELPVLMSVGILKAKG